MEIVIPVRKGGLGNQMFQVTAALIIAKETGKEVVLPKEQPHIHNTFQLHYEETVFKSILQRLQVPVDDYAINTLKQQGFWIYPGEPGFEAWFPSVPKGPVVLHGYFQYYPTLQPHESLIREFFRKNLECKEGNLTKIGIHVRRGDYLKFSDIHSVQDGLYYRRALHEIQKRLKGQYSFVLFSDDLDWCKQQDVFEMLPNLDFCDEKNEVECLKKMIECEGGFICGNSTFSWWAAFLGAYRHKNPVIVPQEWINGYTGSLFPPEWIQLPPCKGTLQLLPDGYLNLHEKKQEENIVKPVTNTVTIHIDASHSPSDKPMYIHMEPNAIRNLEPYLLEHGEKYSRIFTYNQTILNKFSHAVQCVFPACSWISGHHYRNLDLNKKQHKISCITGFKRMTEGHDFRLLLYSNQTALQTLPITFFRSSARPHLPEITQNPFIFKDKFPLFETFQFSIVLENSRQTNYFTEKLIDCLITKTIPIYYGCPNISDYFDTTGWILLQEESMESRKTELFTHLHEISKQPDWYKNHRATVEKNYKTCCENYTSFYEKINKVLLELPEFS